MARGTNNQHKRSGGDRFVSLKKKQVEIDVPSLVSALCARYEQVCIPSRFASGMIIHAKALEQHDLFQ